MDGETFVIDKLSFRVIDPHNRYVIATVSEGALGFQVDFSEYGETWDADEEEEE